MNMPSPFQSDLPGEEQVGKRAYLALALLGIAYAFSFLDRQIMAILAEPIKQDLGLSDTQLGLLTGFMFALFYTTFGIPMAWLADRTNRVRIVAASCALWSAFTAACGFAGSFWQLALARIGVGIGEAGGTPPAYSILSDLFPPARRAMALALYSLGVPAGVVIASGLGGWIADAWGWRMAFIAVGAPGILIALLLVVMVKDPPRSLAEADDGIEKPKMSEAFRYFFRNPLLVLVGISSGLSGFVSYGILNWTPALLIRTKGMAMTDVALHYSWVIGGSMALGIWGGGYLVDRFGARNPRLYALVPAGAFLVAAPFFVAAVLIPGWIFSLALIAVPAVMAMMYLAPALALLQNGTPRAMRSTASAILLLILNIIGLGGGPLFVGMISDALAPHYGAESLKLAMLALTPMFLVTAAAHYWAARKIANAEQER